MVIRTDNQAPTTPGVPPLIPPNDPARRRAHIALILAAVVLVAVVVGGVVLRKHNQKAGTTTTTNTTASQAGSGTTPATLSLSSVVASAYLSDERAWLAVAATFPVDPTDPRIAAALTGDDLSAVRQNLTGAHLLGEVVVGVDRIMIKPTVTAVTATTATVTACVTDNSQVIKHSTGAVVSSGPGGPQPRTITMLLVDGAWKIATNIKGGPAC